MPEKKLVANPAVVLREEFDNWAILFEPDTGNVFGLNPIGVLVWKHLDGRHGIEAILNVIREKSEEVPADVVDHVRDFMKAAIELGLAGYEMN